MGTITEDYVSFETAKLLKEKGFDEYGMYFYTLKDEGREGYKSNKRLQEFAHNSKPKIKERAVSCPTLQMAMKWLREKYYKSIEVRSQGIKSTGLDWIAEIYNLNNQDEEHHNQSTYPSYEEACEAAVKYCLENLI